MGKGEEYGGDRQHQADEGGGDQGRNRGSNQEQPETRLAEEAAQARYSHVEPRPKIAVAHRFGHDCTPRRIKVRSGPRKSIGAGEKTTLRADTRIGGGD